MVDTGLRYNCRWLKTIMAANKDLEHSKREKVKVDPAIALFPLILIASTAVAVAIPLIYSSSSKPEKAPAFSSVKEKTSSITTIDGIDIGKLFNKDKPLRFNTRDNEALPKQFGVDLEIKKLTEKEGETWKMIQDNETWKIVQVKVKEICFLVLSNQSNNDLKHADNLAEYGKQILSRMKYEIFSIPEYSEFGDFVVGVNIRNLYQYTIPGAEEK